jgi:hypothetical protein
MEHIMINTNSTTITRFTDDAAHRYAVEHAITRLGLVGQPTVRWDCEHHLQGHLDVSGRHLVLIAPRTDGHVPCLLTEEEWARLRHGPLAA